MILKRSVTPFFCDGRVYARAHVWTDLGYSSKSFATPAEASTWVPQQSQGDQEMTDHKCPRCGMELKVVEVRVPVYDTIHVPGTQVPKTAIKHYEVREEVADCVRCTGSY